MKERKGLHVPDLGRVKLRAALDAMAIVLDYAGKQRVDSHGIALSSAALQTAALLDMRLRADSKTDESEA